MYTSCFDRYKGENAVSIALRSPTWYRGREYKDLTPNNWFFRKYKQDRDKEFFTNAYIKEVLAFLNPGEVYEELGENAVLLCWEREGEFCHRHIVAKWLGDSLGINIKEFERGL